MPIPVNGPKTTLYTVGISLLICLSLSAPAQMALQETQTVLSLKEAIDLALKSDPGLADARDALSIARRDINRIRGDFFSPTVKIDAGTDVLWNTRSSTLTNSSEASITIQDTLPTGRYVGYISSDEKIAQLQVEEAENDLASAEQAVIYRVVTGYVAVLKAQHSLDLAERSLELSRTQFQDTQTRLNLGVASEGDMLKAEDALRKAEANLESSRSGLNLALARLNQMLGREADHPLTVEGDFRYNPIEPDLSELVSYALAHKSEILKSRNKLTRAQIELEGLIRAEKPIVAVNGSYLGNDLSLGLSIGSPSWDLNWQATGTYSQGAHRTPTGREESNIPEDTWQVGLSITWTPFDGGVGADKREQQKLKLIQAERSIRTQEASIELSIREAYDSLREAGNTVSNAELAVDLARNTLEIAKQRYSNGAVSDREVSQAELSLTQAQRNYDFAVYDYVLAKAKLWQVTGKPIILEELDYEFGGELNAK